MMVLGNQREFSKILEEGRSLYLLECRGLDAAEPLYAGLSGEVVLVCKRPGPRSILMGQTCPARCGANQGPKQKTSQGLTVGKILSSYVLPPSRKHKVKIEKKTLKLVHVVSQ